MQVCSECVVEYREIKKDRKDKIGNKKGVTVVFSYDYAIFRRD